ncbi:replicative DNA helicase [Wohlfahrtiimonas chitiniclastica]|nr:replicative DNA helicase [Wohlfahrtiimonas chitiniclastica]KZS23087.1 replicative DNA helicase [Wohlfahrtiimonas chitiniclastica]MDC7252278.1 replicative DNA helicase [Wohlfahrtiimonas chitiniclastica]
MLELSPFIQSIIRKPVSTMDDQQIQQLKIPPHSIEAEQALLGALLYDAEGWQRIDGRISAIDFYRGDHRLIFTTIQALAEDGKPIDILTVADHLAQQNKLEDAGGRTYLAMLAAETTGATNITAYADIIRDRSIVRQLIGAGSKIVDTGFNPDGKTTAEMLEDAEKSVFAIAEQGSKAGEGLVGINTVLQASLQRLDELGKIEDGITGAPTGWTEFDNMTSGLQNGDMIVVAGRPSMGKTTFAMNIVEAVALSTKKPIAVFSMEMPAEQLVMRMFSSLGRIEQTNLRSGRLDAHEMQRLVSATKQLNQTRIFIDDQGGLSPSEMRARARRLKREEKDLGLIMVDYLQLMKVPGLGEQRVAEVSEISRSLKLMARELEVPVIVLSQLNRSLEQRPNKRPIMSDLRESGAIEQDADLICFIYRDEVYNPESPDKGVAEVIIGKQRNGPIGTVKLAFQGKYSRFANLTTIDYNNMAGTDE